MTSISKQKIYFYLIEIGKWVLILWLLLPIKDSFYGPIDFSRVALGIVLFVIFSGKLLYDVVFFPRQHQAESSTGKDLISMIAIVVGIALLVIVLVFFVALYVMNYLNSNTGPL